MIDRIENPPPGMLRRGSPAIYAGAIPAVVLRVQEIRHNVIGASIALDNSPVLEDRCTDAEFRDLALDLTDPTGRAHLAAWLWGDGIGVLPPTIDKRLSQADWQAMTRAQRFDPMTPAEIDTLARLALRVMGRA